MNILNKENSMIKLIGLNWNADSKGQVLDLLRQCVGIKHGESESCPLCDYKIFNCGKCILPGSKDMKCCYLYKMQKKATVRITLKTKKIGKRKIVDFGDKAFDTQIKKVIKAIEEE